MSRDRGNRAAAWVASYVAAWWPHAEKTPNGRPGADIENTPGVAFEIKTGAAWRNEWMEQAVGHTLCNCKIICAPGCDGDLGDLPVLVYLPPGLGEKNVMHAQATVPLHVLMELLTASGHAPERREVTT